MNRAFSGNKERDGLNPIDAKVGKQKVVNTNSDFFMAIDANQKKEIRAMKKLYFYSIHQWILSK